MLQLMVSTIDDRAHISSLEDEFSGEAHALFLAIVVLFG